MSFADPIAADTTICVICQESLHYDTDDAGALIPVDRRLLFHPARCRRYHGFHLSCAKSQAKADALEKDAAPSCPICRRTYDEEDRLRLLPAERLLQVRVRPADDTSEYDLVVWEHYDPECRLPRDPSAARPPATSFAFRKIVDRRYACAELPLADYGIPRTARPPIHSRTAAVREAAPVRRPHHLFGEAEPTPSSNGSPRQQQQQRRRGVVSERLMESFRMNRLRRLHSSLAARGRLPQADAFQQTVAAHSDLLKSLDAFDERVLQLRRSVERGDLRSFFLDHMQRKLEKLHEYANDFTVDIWDFRQLFYYRMY